MGKGIDFVVEDLLEVLEAFILLSSGRGETCGIPSDEREVLWISGSKWRGFSGKGFLEIEYLDLGGDFRIDVRRLERSLRGGKWGNERRLLGGSEGIILEFPTKKGVHRLVAKGISPSCWEEDFPEDIDEGGNWSGIDLSSFKEVCSFCGKGLKNDSSLTALGGLIGYKGGGWYGTDGRRFNWMKKEESFERLVLDRGSLESFLEIGGWEEWSIGDKWVSFKGEKRRGGFLQMGISFPFEELDKLRESKGWEKLGISLETEILEEIKSVSSKLDSEGMVFGEKEFIMEGERIKYEFISDSLSLSTERGELVFPVGALEGIGKDMEILSDYGILRWREGDKEVYISLEVR